MFILLNEQQIKDKLLSQVQLAYRYIGRFTPVIGAPFGSYNYHLATPNSDLDSYVYVPPTYQEVILNDKYRSTTIKDNENNIIIIKDIRTLFEYAAKENTTAFEILFSEYLISFYKYETYLNRARRLFKSAYAADPTKFYQALLGVGYNSLTYAERETLPIERRIKKTLVTYRVLSCLEYLYNLYEYNKENFNAREVMLSATRHNSYYVNAKEVLESKPEHLSRVINNGYAALEIRKDQLKKFKVDEKKYEEVQEQAKELILDFITNEVIIPKVTK